MTRMRILGLALVAMFAIAAVSAVSASANPQWYECAKETGGKYEKGCGKEGGKGGYNLKPGVGKGKGFKGKGGEAILHNVVPGKGDIKVICASFKDAGSVANVGGKGTEFKVTSTFSKCKSLGAPCSSGAKKETISTEVLAGNLGWLNKSKKEVGASLFNEAKPGTGYLAQFECTGLAKVRVLGGVIGAQVGDVETFEKTTDAIFSVGPYLGELAPGYTPVTNPPAFEEEAVGVLRSELNGPETGNVWAPEGGLPSGQEGTAVNKGEDLLVK
jgi:hypothetical protein